jgi:excisionase family DNA binding protein
MATASLEAPKPTMTVDEAAAFLGISRALAYESIARGELPAIRLGRRILISTSRLHAMVAGPETPAAT